ncbi:armadillo-type protein [Mycena vulgaris]|nr:armadillo-type protein [Mycena vulgaris]
MQTWLDLSDSHCDNAPLARRIASNAASALSACTGTNESKMRGTAYSSANAPPVVIHVGRYFSSLSLRHKPTYQRRQPVDVVQMASQLRIDSENGMKLGVVRHRPPAAASRPRPAARGSRQIQPAAEPASTRISLRINADFIVHRLSDINGACPRTAGLVLLLLRASPPTPVHRRIRGTRHRGHSIFITTSGPSSVVIASQAWRICATISRSARAGAQRRGWESGRNEFTPALQSDPDARGACTDAPLSFLSLRAQDHRCAAKRRIADARTGADAEAWSIRGCSLPLFTSPVLAPCPGVRAHERQQANKERSSSPEAVVQTWSIRARARDRSKMRGRDEFKAWHIRTRSTISRSARAGAQRRRRESRRNGLTPALQSDAVTGFRRLEHPCVLRSSECRITDAPPSAGSQMRVRDKFKAWRIRTCSASVIPLRNGIAAISRSPINVRGLPICLLAHCSSLVSLIPREALPAGGPFLSTSAPSSPASCCRAATYALRRPGTDFSWTSNCGTDRMACFCGAYRIGGGVAVLEDSNSARLWASNVRRALDCIAGRRGKPLSREDMEIYASYLWFKYVSSATKIAILRELTARCDSWEDNAATVADILSSYSLDFFLKSRNAEVQGLTCDLLGHLARQCPDRTATWAASVCKHVASLLRDENSFAREEALHVLVWIARSPECGQAVVDAHVLDGLAELVGSPKSSVRSRACDLLRALASQEVTAVLKANTCEQLVTLLRDEDLNVIIHATEALDSITQSPEGMQAAIDANLLDHITDLLQSRGWYSRGWYTRGWMCSMLAAHDGMLATLVGRTHCKQLVSLLGSHEGKADVVEALRWIAKSPEGAQALVEANVMDLVHGLFRSRLDVVRETCKMLGELASHGSTVTAVLRATPCVRLVSLLRRSQARLNALSALAQISEHPKGVAAIADTDILANVSTLMESEDRVVQSQTCLILRNLCRYQPRLQVES